VYRYTEGAAGGAGMPMGGFLDDAQLEAALAAATRNHTRTRFGLDDGGGGGLGDICLDTATGGVVQVQQSPGTAAVGLYKLNAVGP
jgi:hypothetical protein